MSSRKIAVLVGSLRKESFTLKVAKAFMALAPKSLELALLEIGDLPLYNEDLDDRPPSSWVAFRNKLRDFDGILFFTPEYNRSIPGVLKNALDVGSRPAGQNVWDKKPAGVVSVTPYSLGAFGANHHLRQCLVFLNLPTMQQPEAYIGRAAELFDENGELSKEGTKGFGSKFMKAFEKWVETNCIRSESSRAA